jgi:hypothetical protein
MSRSRRPTARGVAPRGWELENGERLTQPEFHRRYEAYPEDVKFELIGGIVYMASPMKRSHGTSQPKLNLVFGLYEAATPGVEAGDNMTTILGEESEPQPDLLMRIRTEYGGQSRYNADDYLVGAPELVAEIAGSTRSIDMGRKRLDYLQAGVQEYLVYCLAEKELFWFHFPSRRKLKPDRQGVWKSRIFPGLWVDGPALVAWDMPRIQTTAEQGLATPEHAAFVRKLQAARRS